MVTKIEQSRMTLNSPSNHSEMEKVTESRFLLAKYRIQVLEPEKVEGEYRLKLTDDVTQELEKTRHYHAGPVALECKKNGQETFCSRDNCMQMLWCCWLPCEALGQCLFGCLNSCCNMGAEATTHLEESYTLKCCFCCACCKLKK